MTPKTETEKMLSGALYDPGDPALSARRLAARKLARRFNLTDEDDPARAALLDALLPHRGPDTAVQAPVHVDYGTNITFGAGCEVNFNLTALDCGPITIGDHVFIGPNCTLATPIHPFHPAERNPRTRPDGTTGTLEAARPITIGSDCWLASNVVVCGGVTIGPGCVIGAGSVVTRDIPPYSLAVGNPCRVIRPITDADRRETPDKQPLY